MTSLIGLWHFKDYLTQEHVVLDGLDCNQTLENTYWVMQDFMVAIQNNDEKKAIHLLHSKQTVGKQMYQPLLTFKRNYSVVDLNLNLSIKKKVDKNIVMFLSTFIL